MTRKAVASALLILMPFGGMRVVCVEGPVPAPTRQTDQASEAQHGADCDRLCPWPRSADANGGSDSDCALTGDDASVAVIVVTSALTPHVMSDTEMAASEPVAEIPPVYVEPSLVHASPPPKA
jgi:hypothetical protein